MPQTQRDHPRDWQGRSLPWGQAQGAALLGLFKPVSVLCNSVGFNPTVKTHLHSRTARPSSGRPPSPWPFLPGYWAHPPPRTLVSSCLSGNLIPPHLGLLLLFLVVIAAVGLVTLLK